MYWSQWSEENLNLGKISRISMDGSNNTVIFDNKEVTWPSGLALDHSTDDLYFIDSSRTLVAKSNTDGTNLQIILTANVTAVSMDVLDRQLYFSQMYGNATGVFTTNEDDPERNIEEVVSFMGNTPGGIRVVNVSRQPLHSSMCEY